MVGRVGTLAVKTNLPAQNVPGVCAEERILRNPPRGCGNRGHLYVARVTLEDGTIRMAKPCGKCMTLARARGIEVIHYTNWDGEWESLRVG